MLRSTPSTTELSDSRVLQRVLQRDSFSVGGAIYRSTSSNPQPLIGMKPWYRLRQCLTLEDAGSKWCAGWGIIGKDLEVMGQRLEA